MKRGLDFAERRVVIGSRRILGLNIGNRVAPDCRGIDNWNLTHLLGSAGQKGGGQAPLRKT